MWIAPQIVFTNLTCYKIINKAWRDILFMYILKRYIERTLGEGEIYNFKNNIHHRVSLIYLQCAFRSFLKEKYYKLILIVSCL